MVTTLRRASWVLAVLVLGQGGTVLEAGLLKQAAAAAMALAVLAAGEPWPPPAAAAEGWAPGFKEPHAQAAASPFLEEPGQGCSDPCGTQFNLGLIHCETLPPVLRNYCLTGVFAEVEACMRKCLGEAGAAPVEEPE